METSNEIAIKRMTLEHSEKIHQIEVATFDDPWSKKMIEDELTNKHTIYIIAESLEILGYAGMWHVVNEGQITNIATVAKYRQKGVASLLLQHLIQIAADLEMIGLTLEVRLSNIAAQNLYKKHGFKQEGIRKNYYAATAKTPREDAIIMWKYL
ncbi:MAG: ribosomal protein S18-alanine N-acetyltransferase [Firmicutes bacterium]|nr:ribosomal protein S18-alanine N-acetyltransferase [Bacillota bacterium]